MYRLIEPIGIITYLALILAVVSGKMGWKLRSHKVIAIIAVALATVHAVLVMIND